MPPNQTPPELARFGLVSDLEHRAYGLGGIKARSGGRPIYGFVVRELGVQDAVDAAGRVKINPATINIIQANHLTMIEQVRASLVALAYEPIPWKKVPVMDPRTGQQALDEHGQPLWDECEDVDLAVWTPVEQPFTEMDGWSDRLYQVVNSRHQELNYVPIETSKKIDASGSEWRSSGRVQPPTAPAGGAAGGPTGRKRG